MIKCIQPPILSNVRGETREVNLQTPGLESGVYFLLQGQEVVYVGQSVMVLTRVAYHRRGGPCVEPKHFTSAHYLPCTEDRLRKIERYYITQFKPRLNKEGFKHLPF